jgi:hypothetical protein
MDEEIRAAYLEAKQQIQEQNEARNEACKKASPKIASGWKRQDYARTKMRNSEQDTSKALGYLRNWFSR